jgi:hypothetical protein
LIFEKTYIIIIGKDGNGAVDFYICGVFCFGVMILIPVPRQAGIRSAAETAKALWVLAPAASLLFWRTI